MGRIENKLFRIADEILALNQEEAQVAAELEYHRAINDDAQRDAVVSSANVDRLEASATAKDVERFRRRLTQIDVRRRKLEAKRAVLLAKL
jgi:hypothetical protein